MPKLFDQKSDLQKIFASADPSVDKTLSYSRIKFPNSQSSVFDAVETKLGPFRNLDDRRGKDCTDKPLLLIGLGDT